jgi:hypothetical protein
VPKLCICGGSGEIFSAFFPNKIWREIAARRTTLTPEEAKELALRAFRFKKERGRLPSLTSQDAWERRMAEGAAAFVRYKDEGRYE